MDNVTALKALYVSLGGSADTVKNMSVSADIIYAMSQLNIAAAAELPSVSKTDEGKVLKVDSNGKWAVGTDNIEA
jgi:hypothetical protein